MITLQKEDMFNYCPQWHSIDYNNKTDGRDIALQTLIKELEKC